MIELGGILLVSLVAYGLIVVMAHHYGRDWVTPEGTEQSNWQLRHDLGVALGAAAVAISAIACWFTIPSWVGRIVTMAQAVILAASGASDVRKFHLPLPLTLAGITLSIVALSLTHTPLFIVMFGLIWAAALIGLHAALSKGSMALGDHIATIWIALAMPFNGMVAVILGDFANVGVARAKSLKGKKVAAAGAWLIFAAALAGLPPYYSLAQKYLKPSPSAGAELIQPQQQEAMPDLADPLSEVDAETEATPAAEDVAVAIGTPDPNIRVLADVVALARYETGRLAMIDQRAERIKQARRASTKLARLASIAAQRGGSPELVTTLHQLSQSLATYDIEGVQTASEALATVQDDLMAKATARVSQESADSNVDGQDVRQSTSEAAETDSMNTDTTSQ